MLKRNGNDDRWLGHSDLVIGDSFGDFGFGIATGWVIRFFFHAEARMQKQ
jgi:hypothetical protein